MLAGAGSRVREALPARGTDVIWPRPDERTIVCSWALPTASVQTRRVDLRCRAASQVMSTRICLTFVSKVHDHDEVSGVSENGSRWQQFRRLTPRFRHCDGCEAALPLVTSRGVAPSSPFEDSVRAQALANPNVPQRLIVDQRDFSVMPDATAGADELTELHPVRHGFLTAAELCRDAGDGAIATQDVLLVVASSRSGISTALSTVEAIPLQRQCFADAAGGSTDSTDSRPGPSQPSVAELGPRFNRSRYRERADVHSPRRRRRGVEVGRRSPFRLRIIYLQLNSDYRMLFAARRECHDSLIPACEPVRI